MKIIALYLSFSLGNIIYIMCAHKEPLLILSVVPLTALLTFVLQKLNKET